MYRGCKKIQKKYVKIYQNCTKYKVLIFNMSGINQYAIIGYKGMKTVGSYRLHNVSTTTLPKK